MLKKLFCLFISAVLLCSLCPTQVFAETGSKTEISESSSEISLVSVNLWNYSATENYATKMDNAGGKNGNFLYTEEDGSIEWNVEIETVGFYSIRLTYYTMGGKGASIVRNLYIDLSDEAQGNGCVFSRAFVNESDEITTDDDGNQIRSVQVEKEMWLTKDFCDPNGYSSGALSFYLEPGIHTIKLESVREPMLIGAIELYIPQEPELYSEYVSKTDSLKISANIDPIYIQGEAANLKSDSMLYQLSDRSSSATQPSSAVKTVLNTIGGDKWSSYGQWLCWEFEVEQAGYYKMSFRAKQDFVAGQPSYRKIYISNGPDFKELESVKFDYMSGWQMYTVGNSDGDYRLYLEPGVYTLKMEVVLGEMADIVQRVQQSMEVLNEIYLSFLMLIGPNPDKYRDYQFKTYLPDELEALKKQSEELEKIYEDYLKLSETGGSQAQSLKNLSDLTAKMGNQPNKIASVFSEFSDSISALGTWMTTARSQSLEVDYIVFSEYDDDLPSPKASFFSNFVFGFKQFIASFSDEYSSAKEENKDSVTVWLSTGRDQANALINMADNYFTPETGIDTDIQLVVDGALLTATLAGRGPDVALSLAQNLPVNYAIRGAVMDLTQFEDLEEVKGRFKDSAIEPLSFNSAIYGLPETQSFYVMFYRTDILKKLNLSVPNTWDEVIAMLPILNQNNMSFGLPIPMNTTATGVGFNAFAMFLYQNGGSFYTDNGKTALLDSDEASAAFKLWTDFYTQYSLPYNYSFQNRFRSGEIPIGIADYGTYNVLSVFAPELNGLWDFALVPGIQTEDGINRTVSSSVTASVIMSDADNPENAWEFLKWWTSGEMQDFFGNEIESIMGTAGRYQTANVESLEKIPWNTKDLDVLLKQWEYTKGIPEVPGSYMTSRYVDFGFKQVILGNTTETDPIQILINQNKRINEEIKAKRKEFGLD